jgi:Domain of unknown function (DUF6927)
MGWTGMHREPGISDRAFFEAEFPLGLKRDGQILDCATVSNTFYAAVRDHADGKVWALVVLMQRVRGEFNFCYKELDEAMGPAEDRCPVRILDLLSPTSNEYAVEWRARCRVSADRREKASAVKPGTVIKLARVLEFGNGVSSDTFRLIGRSTFGIPGQGGRYSIPNWRDNYEWEVVTS